MFRIWYAVRHEFLHKPDACRLAHSTVLLQCPQCSDCTPAAAGCTSVAKDRRDDVPYDCTRGYSDFVRGWTAAKKDWCCKHERLGCPSALAGIS